MRRRLAGLTLILLMLTPSYAYAGEGSVVGPDWNVLRRVAVAADEAGWPADLIVQAIAVAMAESGGDPFAVGDRDADKQNGTWGDSHGLMQVRTMPSQTGTGGPRDKTNLFDPVANMRAALSLYRGENFKHGKRTWYEPGGWSPQWSVVTNERYKDFLDDAATANAEWQQIRDMMR